jgi:hypothetical protein
VEHPGSQAALADQILGPEAFEPQPSPAFKDAVGSAACLGAVDTERGAQIVTLGRQPFQFGRLDRARHGRRELQITQQTIEILNRARALADQIPPRFCHDVRVAPAFMTPRGQHPQVNNFGDQKERSGPEAASITRRCAVAAISPCRNPAGI